MAQYTVIWRGTTPQLYVILVQSAVLYINIGIPPYLKSSNYTASCPLLILPSTLQHNAPCSEICNLSNEHAFEHVVITNRAVTFRSIHWSISRTTVILYSTCGAAGSMGHRFKYKQTLKHFVTWLGGCCSLRFNWRPYLRYNQPWIVKQLIR